MLSRLFRAIRGWLEPSEAGHFEACYGLIAGTTRVAVLHNQFSALHQPLKKDLQRKLNDPGPRRQRLLQAPPPLGVPSGLKIWALLEPKKGKSGVKFA